MISCYCCLGYYTHSTILDYPSISQINYIAQESSFLVIFAVAPRYKNIYKEMEKLVIGSSVEILDTDSENIFNFIRESYIGLTSTIKVRKTV